MTNNIKLTHDCDKTPIDSKLQYELGHWWYRVKSLANHPYDAVVVHFCPNCGEKLENPLNATALFHDLEALGDKYDVRFDINYIFKGQKRGTDCRIWRNEDPISLYSFELRFIG